VVLHYVFYGIIPGKGGEAIVEARKGESC